MKALEYDKARQSTPRLNSTFKVNCCLIPFLFQPRNFKIVEVPIPKIGDNDVLVKG